MEPGNIAGLKRKHAATEEPAKKAELAQKLRLMGHDPEAEEKDSEDRSGAPKGRTADKKVTAEDSKPKATASKDEEKPKAAESKTTAAKDEDKSRPAARPSRAAKSTDTSKSEKRG